MKQMRDLLNLLENAEVVTNNHHKLDLTDKEINILYSHLRNFLRKNVGDEEMYEILVKLKNISNSKSSITEDNDPESEIPYYHIFIYDKDTGKWGHEISLDNKDDAKFEASDYRDKGFKVRIIKSKKGPLSILSDIENGKV